MDYNQSTTDWKQKQAQTIARIYNYRRKNAKMIRNLRDTCNPELEGIAEKLEPCATYLAFSALESGQQKIINANFCRQRLCAVCAWRRQLKFVATTYPALELLRAAGHKFVFVSLTVRNVKGEELSRTITQLSKGYTRMMKTSLFSGVAGYVRSIEVTTNGQTYHPHIHAIVIMPPEYSPIHEDYIPWQELIKAWRKAARLDTDPDIDIRFLRPTRAGQRTYIETIKYSLKPAPLKPAELEDVYYALKGRHLISFGGILANLRKAMSDDVLTDQAESTDKWIAQTVWQLNPHGGVYEIVSEIERRPGA